MKKFSQLIKESKQQLSIQDDSVNYLNTDEIKKYLEIADKFISEESKNVCKWLISNNDTYVDKFKSDDENNALAAFYNKGFPKNESDDLKDLYKNITSILNNNRIMEIPVFMTRNQFDSIINKTASPDEIIMDLVSEKGRNEVVKKYMPLVHKIVNSWLGKTSFNYDDLMSIGLEGLTYAMNSYGKKSKKQTQKEEKTGEKIDISKYKSYTFLQYAAQMIRVSIIEATKVESHLVRIPVSRQKVEKEKNGYIAKSNSVSGDKKMGSKDGGDGKSLFDLVGGMENPGKEMDRKEIEELWNKVLKQIKDHFHKEGAENPDQTFDIFCNHFGLGLKQGEKKLSGKEMAKKYGYSSPSSITAEIYKVLTFIKKNNKIYQKFVDIFELMQEAKHDEDEYDNDNEPIYVTSKLYNDFNELNNIDGD